MTFYPKSFRGLDGAHTGMYKETMTDSYDPASDLFRQCMRHWTTGVAVACSAWAGKQHGMTVNSFVSISMHPPLFCVTINQHTRTWDLIRASGKISISILSRGQRAIADRFAGRTGVEDDRFAGLDVLFTSDGLPWFSGSLAALTGSVLHEHPLEEATLFIARVREVCYLSDQYDPLVYLNRAYHTLEKE